MATIRAILKERMVELLRKRGVPLTIFDFADSIPERQNVREIIVGVEALIEDGTIELVEVYKYRLKGGPLPPEGEMT